MDFLKLLTINTIGEQAPQSDVKVLHRGGFYNNFFITTNVVPIIHLQRQTLRELFPGKNVAGEYLHQLPILYQALRG